MKVNTHQIKLQSNKNFPRQPILEIIYMKKLMKVI